MTEYDHRNFVSNLDPKLKVKLTQRSDIAGMRHLAYHIGLIIFLGLCVLLGGPIWFLFLVPLGIALVFLFTLEHECTHKTPFLNQFLNETVGHLCGVILILPFTWFRYFHLAHHKWTNIPGKDPEIAAPRPETWWNFVCYLSGIPYWIAAMTLLFQNALGRNAQAYIPTSAHRRIRSEARIMLALYAVIIASLWFTPLLFWLWIVPCLFGQPFLRIYLLAEHGRCPLVANMFENTRTTFTNKMVRFLAWNMPYHTEHHVFPNVPFHQLPSLHEQTQKHLKITADGYSKFAKDFTKSL